MQKENKFRVIVVEDEHLIRNNLIKKIKELALGFEVIAAAQNGKDALKYIEETVPDLIITDIRMPLMDGLELLEHVSIYYPYIKKIIISGYDEFEYARKALRLGVVEYLLKPIKLTDLSEILNKIRIELENEIASLYEILPKSENEYSLEKIIELVEVFIRENYQKNININMIAQKFNYNPSYLSKIFTKQVGENPSNYLIKLRINKAKQLLLKDKGLTVKQIGEIVGYAEPAYFSRIFKKYTGQSPSEFRNLI